MTVTQLLIVVEPMVHYIHYTQKHAELSFEVTLPERELYMLTQDVHKMMSMLMKSPPFRLSSLDPLKINTGLCQLSVIEGPSISVRHLNPSFYNHEYLHPARQHSQAKSGDTPDTPIQYYMGEGPYPKKGPRP